MEKQVHLICLAMYTEFPENCKTSYFFLRMKKRKNKGIIAFIIPSWTFIFQKKVGFICFNGRLLKIMKNCFYVKNLFYVKSLFRSQDI